MIGQARKIAQEGVGNDQWMVSAMFAVAMVEMVTKQSGNSCNSGKPGIVLVALPALAPSSPKCLSTSYRVAVTVISINNNHNGHETSNNLH